MSDYQKAIRDFKASLPPQYATDAQAMLDAIADEMNRLQSVCHEQFSELAQLRKQLEAAKGVPKTLTTGEILSMDWRTPIATDERIRIARMIETHLLKVVPAAPTVSDAPIEQSAAQVDDPIRYEPGEVHYAGPAYVDCIPTIGGDYVKFSDYDQLRTTNQILVENYKKQVDEYGRLLGKTVHLETTNQRQAEEIERLNIAHIGLFGMLDKRDGEIGGLLLRIAELEAAGSSGREIDSKALEIARKVMLLINDREPHVGFTQFKAIVQCAVAEILMAQPQTNKGDDHE